MLLRMKQQLLKGILTALVMLVVGDNAFAVWMGAGEVTGTVLNSRRVGERVDFEMTVTTQMNELHGSRLASPNIFTYSGPRMLEISGGDKLQLRVRSSNAYGIIVESIEIQENQPGAPEEVPPKSLGERAEPFVESVIFGAFAVSESPLAMSLLVLLLLAPAVIVWWRRVCGRGRHEG